MAMCTTGNLSICSTAGTCRSISTAVGTGSGTGCGSFSVCPNGNEGTTVRSGGITVESSAPNQTISVTQDPNV